MFKFLMARRRIASLVLVVPACVALAAHPTWAQSLGLDVWNVSALRQELRELTAQSDRLSTEDDDARQRILMKEAIVTDLIAGRAALPEVTAQFLALDAERPAHLQVIRDTFPGATDEEKMARNVVQYTLSRVPADQRDEVSSRLEGELQQMLAVGAEHAE